MYLIKYQVRVWCLHVLRLKIEGSHLRKCKTTYECLNFSKRMEILERNKYGLLPSTTVLIVISVSNKKPK